MITPTPKLMKTSELIAILQTSLVTHGDLEVMAISYMDRDRYGQMSIDDTMISLSPRQRGDGDVLVIG